LGLIVLFHIFGQIRDKNLFRFLECLSGKYISNNRQGKLLQLSDYR